MLIAAAEAGERGSSVALLCREIGKVGAHGHPTAAAGVLRATVPAPLTRAAAPGAVRTSGQVEFEGSHGAPLGQVAADCYA